MDRTQRATGDYAPQSGNHGEHGVRGQHEDTSVHQRMNPIVTHETIKPTRHEEINKSVEKEIHQDHYRQKVQPIHDREVLPEKHHHNQAGVVQREFDHRDNAATERALRNEAGRFRDERVVTDTTKTQSHAPGSEREHVHHHVHENIQPVLKREVIQPEVVHTTVPIHEVHHEQARTHGTTTLPSVSLDEFKRQAGGGLGGSHHSSSHHTSTEHRSNVGSNMGTHERGVGGHHHNSSMLAETEAATGANRGMGKTARPAGARRSSSSSVSSSDNEMRSTKTKSKPSLMDKLNPMKDADGDGKAGFMS